MIPHTPKKTKVFLLVDNRTPPKQEKQTSLKKDILTPIQDNHEEKDTGADLLDSHILQDTESWDSELVIMLSQKLEKLESRVQRLESMKSIELGGLANGSGEKKGKIRRRFSEMKRDIKCQEANCTRVYQTQTALKNHIKLKHTKKE